MSQYRVVITLSHRTISFEYNQDSAEGLLLPFPETSNPEALAFYCEADRVVVGNQGLSALEEGKSGAFTDYFELIKQGESFKYCGTFQPHQFLLLHSLEDRFRSFLRSIIINKGSLDDNRATMPLLFVLENDIQPNERRIISDLFINAGYQNVHFHNADEYVHKLAIERRFGQRVLSAWSDGTDLILSLMFPDGSSKTLPLPGLGTDPRIRHVVEKLYDDLKSELWTSLDEEREALTKVARNFIMSKAPELDDMVILSDKMEHSIFLSKTWLNTIPMKESDHLQFALSSFLKENGCTDRTPVLLLLRGALIGNDYFRQQLSTGFGEVREVDEALQAQINKLIAQTKMVPGPRPPIRPTPQPTVQPIPEPAQDKDKETVEKVRDWFRRAELSFNEGKNEQGDSFIDKGKQLMFKLSRPYSELSEMLNRVHSSRKKKPEQPVTPRRPDILTGDEISTVKTLLRNAKEMFVIKNNNEGDRFLAEADRIMSGKKEDATLQALRQKTLGKRSDNPEPKRPQVTPKPETPKPEVKKASKPKEAPTLKPAPAIKPAINPTPPSTLPPAPQKKRKRSMMETQDLTAPGLKIKASPDPMAIPPMPTAGGMPFNTPPLPPGALANAPKPAATISAPPLPKEAMAPAKNVIKNAEARALMKAGRYTQAKTIFMNEGDQEMIQICNTLNRAARQAKVAEEQLASANTPAKKAEHTKTIADFKALRKMYGLD